MGSLLWFGVPMFLELVNCRCNVFGRVATRNCGNKPILSQTGIPKQNFENYNIQGREKMHKLEVKQRYYIVPEQHQNVRISYSISV